MVKYLVKQIFNSGVLVGHEVKHQTTAKHLPRGGNYIFIEGVNTKFPKLDVDIDDNMSIIEDANKILLKEAYVQMDTDVASEASLKTGTANRESMLAFVSAYQLRMSIPEKYVDVGLLAEIEIAGFLIGDPLDDAIKIKVYYTEVLFYLDLHRMGKIKDYLNTKKSLGF